MRKILFFITFATLPFVAATSANLPPGGGYAGPYIYEEEAGYGYLEGDAVYEESTVTFDRSAGRMMIMADFDVAANCSSENGGSPICSYCASITGDCDDYFECRMFVMLDAGVSCEHIKYTETNGNCLYHSTPELNGGSSLPCPIGGNAALMLIFALPYGIVRLCRKRKKE
ncbi:MAG: hypothetical protein LBN27_13125 [Prevotellaceae bacterium]|jgi:hypothetical protein|nr:hypothetical protein [Prevotellaceae bacterium]